MIGEEKFIEDDFGYCYYVFDEDYNISEDDHKTHAIIFNLYIYQKYRHQGKAKNLLKTVIDEIRNTGYDDEIRISANPRENSINLDSLVLFYKTMGLKVYII